MYAGYVVEDAPVDDLFTNPKHPYTLGLLGSLPRPNDPPGSMLYSIPGQPPSLVALSPGCPFAPRCTYLTDKCKQENPDLATVGLRHRVACWHHEKLEGGWAGVR